MPELPEVEVVRRQLEDLLPKGEAILSYRFARPNLRWPLPSKKEMKKVLEQPLKEIDRKSKYLIFDFGTHYTLSHLGMSGRWRVLQKNENPRTHDHLFLKWSHGLELVYEDPRRFGHFAVGSATEPHVLLAKLGVDALKMESDREELIESFRRKKVSMKSALMDQSLLAGLGNIYVNEGLFLAGISPFQMTSKISSLRWESLLKIFPPLLQRAIERGGSTLRDYQHLNSDAGAFQTQFLVYGRDGEKCTICHQKIKVKQQHGRATFWCSHCQK